MGFKSDREFLRNVSIGAIGTRKVAEILRRGGFEIIELERYSSSNKIWATKIKRLRVPDLLCLRSGIRIESRGKSSLEVTMSHAVNNPDRAWDKGLRDDDLIAFIKCSPKDDSWQASDHVALFRVGDMRSKAAEAGLSRMKSTAEGSEIRLTWPATVPGTAGHVTGVSSDKIETLLSSGRKQTYRLDRKGKSALFPYVAVGDEFGEGDTVIASLMPQLIPPHSGAGAQYDFVADLQGVQAENVYVAVKALGHLPALCGRSVAPLTEIARAHEDPRIRLESAASLARLSQESGWAFIEAIALNNDTEPAYRMESALILGELATAQSAALLNKLATEPRNSSELRAAAAWSLSAIGGSLPLLLPLTWNADEITAVHAIVGTGRLIDDENIGSVLQQLANDDRQSAGVARATLSSRVDFLPETIRQLKAASSGRRRQWLLDLIAAAGQNRAEPVVRQLAPDLEHELDFFWTYHASNWTNRLDVADQINFLEQQTT